MKKEETFMITPKGIIFLALGGYTAEADGFPSGQHANKICDGLKEFLGDKWAVGVVDNQLKFVKLAK